MSNEQPSPLHSTDDQNLRLELLKLITELVTSTVRAEMAEWRAPCVHDAPSDVNALVAQAVEEHEEICADALDATVPDMVRKAIDEALAAHVWRIGRTIGEGIVEHERRFHAGAQTRLAGGRRNG